MRKAFTLDLMSFSADSLVMRNNSDITPIEERENDNFGEEQSAKKSLFSEKDKIDTITESEEENNSSEVVSHGHSSRSSSKSIINDKKMVNGRWTANEHQLFLEGLVIYGNEWKMVQKHIQTRSSTQARSHAQKFFIKIRKSILHETDKGVVKNIIHDVFKKEMQEQFMPANLPLFLDKITALVFASDKNKKLRVPSTTRIKSTSQEANNNNTPPSSIPNKEIESFSSSSSSSINQQINSFNCLRKMKQKQLLIRKEKYFKIEKDKEKEILKTNRPFDQEKELFPNINKSYYYENSPHTTYNTSTSYINYVTITMVSNSDHSNLQNSNQDRKNDATNPFNLQFEEILNKSNCSNLGKNYNNNSTTTIINMPDEDKQYYNDDYSCDSFI